MFKALMLVVALVSTSINNLSHAETNTLNANKVLEPFIFEIGSNFSDIQTALLHKDLKCKAPLIEPNLRRNLGKWST